MEERQRAGPFADRVQFEQRMGPRLPPSVLRALEAAGALAGLAGGTRAVPDAGAQLDLFTKAAPPAAEAAGDDVTAFGFPWPEARGPVVLKLAPEAPPTVLRAVAEVAAAYPGPVGWVLATGGRRGRPLPELPPVSASWSCLRAVAEVAGVDAVVRALAAS